MKQLFLAAGVLAALAAPVQAADVGVSISIGQPGFFGQIELGDIPRPPPLIYRQPVVIERPVVVRPPIYLNVPPGHAKHWRKHCGKYNACGERVYFVQNSWYDREYVPHYRQRHRGGDDRYDDDRRGGNDNGRHGHGRGNKHRGGGNDDDDRRR